MRFGLEIAVKCTGKMLHLLPPKGNVAACLTLGMPATNLSPHIVQKSTKFFGEAEFASKDERSKCPTIRQAETGADLPHRDWSWRPVSVWVLRLEPGSTKSAVQATRGGC